MIAVISGAAKKKLKENFRTKIVCHGLMLSHSPITLWSAIAEKTQKKLEAGQI